MQLNPLVVSSDEQVAWRLLGIISGSWMSQAVYVAAVLGLADHLAAGPQSAEALAAAMNAHSPSLRRFLRALTTIGVCTELDDGTFELAPMGRLLETQNEFSLRHWAIYWGGNLWTVWGNLLHSIKTGESARKLLTHTEGFEHLERDGSLTDIYHQAMTELTRLNNPGVVEACGINGSVRIVDVGGGSGELLSAVLASNQHATGVLFDLPPAVEKARQCFTDMGLEKRCEFVAGSFFDSVPSLGNVYILKSILHDWDDDHCEMILRNCREAMSPSSKLLLIERIMPQWLDSTDVHQSMARSDLHMLVALGGRERTAGEFVSLLSTAGLRPIRIVPAGLTLSVMEATL
jgi:hypothetical protein